MRKIIWFVLIVMVAPLVFTACSGGGSGTGGQSEGTGDSSGEDTAGDGSGSADGDTSESEEASNALGLKLDSDEARVAQGLVTSLTALIDNDGVAGNNITLSLLNPPSGITMEDKIIAVGSPSVDLSIGASADIPIDTTFDLTIRASDGTNTGDFPLSLMVVKNIPASERVAISTDIKTRLNNARVAQISDPATKVSVVRQIFEESGYFISVTTNNDDSMVTGELADHSYYSWFVSKMETSSSSSATNSTSAQVTTSSSSIQAKTVVTPTSDVSAKTTAGDSGDGLLPGSKVAFVYCPIEAPNVCSNVTEYGAIMGEAGYNVTTLKFQPPNEEVGIEEFKKVKNAALFYVDTHGNCDEDSCRLVTNTLVTEANAARYQDDIVNRRIVESTIDVCPNRTPCTDEEEVEGDRYSITTLFFKKYMSMTEAGFAMIQACHSAGFSSQIVEFSKLAGATGWSTSVSDDAATKWGDYFFKFVHTNVADFSERPFDIASILTAGDEEGLLIDDEQYDNKYAQLIPTWVYNSSGQAINSATIFRPSVANISADIDADTSEVQPGQYVIQGNFGITSSDASHVSVTLDGNPATVLEVKEDETDQSKDLIKISLPGTESGQLTVKVGDFESNNPRTLTGWKVPLKYERDLTEDLGCAPADANMLTGKLIAKVDCTLFIRTDLGAIQSMPNQWFFPGLQTDYLANAKVSECKYEFSGVSSAKWIDNVTGEPTLTRDCSLTGSGTVVPLGPSEKVDENANNPFYRSDALIGTLHNYDSHALKSAHIDLHWYTETKTLTESGSNADGVLTMIDTDAFGETSPQIVPQALSAMTFDSSSTYFIDDMTNADRYPSEMTAIDGILLEIDPGTYTIKEGTSPDGYWSWEVTPPW